MKIEMTKQDRENAKEWGGLRTIENTWFNDIPQYNKKYCTFTSFQANALGVYAELAVVKYLGLPKDVQEGKRPDVWAAFVPLEEYSKYIKQADIGGVVEVRRVNKRDFPITVRTKDLKQSDAIIIQAFVPFTRKENGLLGIPLEVEVNGWAPVSDYSNGRIAPWDVTNTDRLVQPRSLDDLDLAGIRARMGVEQ